MKCSDCKNYKVGVEHDKKDVTKKTGGTCTINNKVCDPGDECKTGLFDKMSAM